jgi:VCBS repeat-containing protein
LGIVAFGAGANFTFDPNGAFEGLQAGQSQQVQFTYGVKDPSNLESTSVVTLNVTGVNDVPTAAPFSLSIAEDGGSVTGNFLGDDADADDNPTSLTYLISTNVPAGQGTLLNNNNGTVTYTIGTAFQNLADGESRDIPFGYRARDRQGALSDIVTATIRVTGVNDAPQSAGVQVNTTENAPHAITLVGTDVDAAETATLTYTIFGGVGAGQGTLGPVTGNTVEFDPGTDFDALSSGQTQQVMFSYQSRDVNEAFSIPGSVTITVTGENDAPTASDVSMSAIEDGPRVTALLAGEDVDNNDDPDSLTYQLLSVPPAGQGSVLLTGTRTIEFNPGADFQDLTPG